VSLVPIGSQRKSQDTNEDRVMPIALHCMEKHECIMHISCVVFEDKCHFRKTEKIRPPVPGVNDNVESRIRPRASSFRAARTFVEDTSVTHITIRTQNEVGLFLRAGKRTKSGYYSKSIESNISGDSGATCSSEPERDDARA
jgi:hypothetical protein